jgi:coatomer subunit beta'
MYLLGYILKQCRLYLVDKSLNLVCYSLEDSVLAYQTAILRGDIDGAAKVLPRIPKEHRNRIAQFLEAQGLTTITQRRLL